MVDIPSISVGLELGDDGIWYAPGKHDVSYPSDGNEYCFSVEDRSFWFAHRNNCIVSVVKSFPPEDRGTIFDIGGGNGIVSLRLANEGFAIVLVEPGRAGALNARSRGLEHVICASIQAARFNEHSLPAVGLFDVIEHIDDDLAFLQSVRNLMKVGGRLYATVPSHRFLWSASDSRAGHFRRYALADICHVLEAVGFEIEFGSYIFRLLPIPVFLLRTLPYRVGLSRRDKRGPRRSVHDHAVKGGAVAAILNTILQPEIENLGNGRAMGVGSSCLVVASIPEHVSAQP